LKCALETIQLLLPVSGRLFFAGILAMSHKFIVPGPGKEQFPLPARRGEGQGEGIDLQVGSRYDGTVNPTSNARRLRRDQTLEEKQLWRALRAGRFAGFKFRPQHPDGKYVLDFYCPRARLSVELDGFGHGNPGQREQDVAREQWLAQEGIEELRFWNRQWRRNPAGVLLEIWQAVQRRTGCVAVVRLSGNNRFVPPSKGQLIEPPIKSPF